MNSKQIHTLSKCWLSFLVLFKSYITNFFAAGFLKYKGKSAYPDAPPPPPPRASLTPLPPNSPSSTSSFSKSSCCILDPPFKFPITPDLIPLFHLELSPVNFFSDIARSAKRTPPRKCSETENIKCFFWKCASANKSQDKLFCKYIAAINSKLLFPEKIWDTKIFLVLC